MNKIKSIFTLFLLFFIIFIFFKYNYIINYSCIIAFNIWINKIFPSLFIMFILSNLLVETNLISLFPKIFNKLFKISNNSNSIFIFSFFSSCPSNFIVIKELLNKNIITTDEANNLSKYTFFSNPLFLYNILLITFNKYITLKIIFSHYFANFIIALLNRNNNIINNNSNDNKLSFNITYIPISINKSINTLIMILGTICFYLIISNIITNIFNLSIITEVLLKGFLEITQGLNILSKINNISIIKEIIAISIISFGGLSIHTQVISIIHNTNIKYINFLKNRLLHVIISLIIYTCIINI